MNRGIKHINKNSFGQDKINTRNGFDNDPLAGNDDLALFESIGDFMKGYLDMEDVKNDPALSYTNETVKEMISDYNMNISANSDNERFIKEIFSIDESGNNFSDEVNVIKQEINDKHLNLVTAEWVREWHEKKQRTGVPDAKSDEIRNFISDAINAQITEAINTTVAAPRNISFRKGFVRYTSLTAAAVLGVYLLIRTLLPSSNTDALFSSYYKPFDAVSPVTRSINQDLSDNYSKGITSYKNGDYKAAVAGFEEVLEKDPKAESARFYQGLSQLALQNWDQTINSLSDVANKSGEYGKEARWYLGLSYLKSGNKVKAIECFENLVKSDGFYHDRADKILRRLK